ncbi:MAG: GNAT family N-acetyltransferase [Roseburia sp.]|nr:GNAT family N-acetyltransferase [Roseburia sp.]
MNIRFASMTDLDAIAELEKKCFPAAEAASRESFEKRLATFPNHFWVLEEDGEIVSLINGLVTDIPILRDEMYADASIHNEKGAWQMIFGVETAPEHQGKGYASLLMRQVIEDCEKQERKGIVLTCKNGLISFYEKFGFINEGKSMSKHGGVAWNEMRLAFFEV